MFEKSRDLPDDERARVAERLLRNRTVDEVTGCWLWTGFRNEAGYGITKVLGRKGWLDRVHRLSLVVFAGAVLGDACVLHRCDVRNCFNPEHLFTGTKQDNTDDMHAKGRWRPPAVRRGQDGTNARLRDADVLDMVAATRLGESRASLARRYGVALSTVSCIVLGKNWKHLTANANIPRSPRGPRSKHVA